MSDERREAIGRALYTAYADGRVSEGAAPVPSWTDLDDDMRDLWCEEVDRLALMDTPEEGEMASKRVAEIRQAVADYMESEGCSCCCDTEAHEAAAERLAKMLDVPMYEDGWGYDFGRFSTRTQTTQEGEDV